MNAVLTSKRPFGARCRTPSQPAVPREDTGYRLSAISKSTGRTRLAKTMAAIILAMALLPTIFFQNFVANPLERTPVNPLPIDSAKFAQPLFSPSQPSFTEEEPFAVDQATFTTLAVDDKRQLAPSGDFLSFAENPGFFSAWERFFAIALDRPITLNPLTPGSPRSSGDDSPIPAGAKSRLARVTFYWPQEGDFHTRQHLSSTGERLRDGHCAVDPNVIPYGSVVKIPGLGKAVAVDTGAAVVSRRAARNAGRTAQEKGAPVVDVFCSDQVKARELEANFPHFVVVTWYPSSIALAQK
jgi:3D (Asp-Asp-Asp) domain-containing protein